MQKRGASNKGPNKPTSGEAGAEGAGPSVEQQQGGAPSEVADAGVEREAVEKPPQKEKKAAGTGKTNKAAVVDSGEAEGEEGPKSRTKAQGRVKTKATDAGGEGSRGDEASEKKGKAADSKRESQRPKAKAVKSKAEEAGPEVPAKTKRRGVGEAKAEAGEGVGGDGDGPSRKRNNAGSEQGKPAGTEEEEEEAGRGGKGAPKKAKNSGGARKTSGRGKS